MMNLLSRKITAFLLQKNIVSSDEAEIYEYGFELIISTMLGFILVITAGIVLGRVPETFAFYFTFVLVRPFSGGYHAKTHFKCKLSLVCVYLAVMFFDEIFMRYYSIGYQLLLLAAYILVILIYAPIENPNKPLDDEERSRNRKISIIIACTLTFASLLMLEISVQTAVTIAITLFSTAMLMIITKVGKEEIENEKDLS